MLEERSEPAKQRFSFEGHLFRQVLAQVAEQFLLSGNFALPGSEIQRLQTFKRLAREV